MSGVSFVLHIALVLFLSLNPWPTIVKARPEAYTVTLMPIPLQEPEKTSSLPVIKEEIPKPVEKPKKDDIIEKIKKTLIKKEIVEKEKVSLKHLQEAIEEIRKKAALDEIQKKVSRREKVEERPVVALTNPPSPSISSLKSPPERESKLNEYYGMIWVKIKEMWTIPENLLKEMADWETVVVITINRDGKIREMWVEKRSGNAFYDQMAMRAIKKAEPLPPIPKEFGENTLEIGIRFLPD
jgi:colicin import membrane protein